MTDGEEAARAGNRESMQKNHTQMALTDESRRLLADLLEDRVRVGVAEGIQGAMTSANARLFMRSLITEAQQVAAEKSTEMVGGAVKALAVKAVHFLLLGSLVYSLGGWSAIAALAKWVIAQKG